MEELKIAMKRQSQEAIKLVLTKACLQMWREARSLLIDPTEFWLLAQAIAKMEWGPYTVLDDFEVEGMVVVRSGARRIEL